MAVVGPGANPDQDEDIRPLLEGASEFEYVTILNPLRDDFAVRVAQDVPVNVPFQVRKDSTGKTSFLTNDEAGARQVYGLNLKNPDFQGRRHLYSDTIIKAGQTINLKGNEAQVAVRQLVNEILQREGQRRLIADPVKRREVEERIVITRASVQELLNGSTIQSARDQINEAVSRSNEVINGPAFPTLNNGPAEGDTERGGDSGAEAISQERRIAGRPKKAESVTHQA